MLGINDLSRIEPTIADAIEAAVARVIRSGWYVLGPNVEQFEAEFAAYCGTSECVSVANGTDALGLALAGLGVKAGDKVITVANAGGYATTAILGLGALPAYVEVDEESMLMSLPELELALRRERPAAVIVTHLYGRNADAPAIVALGRRFGVPVVEDCAQSHGSTFDGRRSGSVADAGCFSFYPTKNLGAAGDGGAVICNDRTLAGKVRSLRQYGWSSKYVMQLRGGVNSRLDEVQAAVLRIKLPYLEVWNNRRKDIARAYSRGIVHPGVRLAALQDGSDVAHLFVIRVGNRGALREHLRLHGIASDIHYPVPDHLQKPLRELLGEMSLPVTERVSREVLTLPCFPAMTEEEVKGVVEAVNGWESAGPPML